MLNYLVTRANISLMVIGILGNIFCMIVFLQKELLNRKFNYYLLLLALAEFFFCCIVLANSLAFLVSNGTLFIFDLNVATCLLTDFIINSIDAYCVFLTLTVSIDRLYAIINPIKIKSFITSRNPKLVAFIGYIIILILKSPEIILTQREYMSAEVDNGTYMSYAGFGTCAYKNQSHNLVQAYVITCGIFLPILLNVAPAIIILGLNITLLAFMKRYSRGSSSNGSSKRNSININTNKTVIKSRTLSVTQKSHYYTIVILGAWLLITSVPFYTFNTIYWVSQLKIFSDTNFEINKKVQPISSVFFNSNHCINMIIYLIFHKVFRMNAIKVFLKITRLNKIVSFQQPTKYGISSQGLRSENPVSNMKSSHTNLNELTPFLNRKLSRSALSLSMLCNNDKELNKNKIADAAMVSNHLSAQMVTNHNRAPLMSMNGLLKNSRQYHSNLSLNSYTSSIFPRHSSVAVTKSPEETSMDEAKVKRFRCCDFEIIKNRKPHNKKIERDVSRSYLGSEEVLNYKLSFNKDFFKPINLTSFDSKDKGRNGNGNGNGSCNGRDNLNEKYGMGTAKYDKYF